MPEFQQNIWAPWRMEYISELHEGEAPACFLCDYAANPQRDADNLVVLRGRHTLMLMNRFPYTGGHLLIAPLEHGGDLAALPPEVGHELSARLADGLRVLADALSPQGFNIGMNLGRCAGAGLPDHLHWHIVPRWGGDTNFMPVVGDVRVIPEALRRTHERLCAAVRKLGVGG